MAEFRKSAYPIAISRLVFVVCGSSIGAGCGGNAESSSAYLTAGGSPPGTGGAAEKATGSGGASGSVTALETRGGGTQSNTQEYVVGGTGSSAGGESSVVATGGASPVVATGGAAPSGGSASSAAAPSGGASAVSLGGDSGTAAATVVGGAAVTSGGANAAGNSFGAAAGLGGMAAGGSLGSAGSTASLAGGTAGASAAGGLAGGTSVPWSNGGACAVGVPALPIATGGGAGEATNELGASCSSWGATACDSSGNLALVCSGQWTVLQTCATGEVCDRSIGVCSAVLPECKDHDPGYTYCVDNILKQCSESKDMLTSYTCCGTCSQGVCFAPGCGDGKLDTGEECDDGNIVPADGCDSDCKSSAVVAIAGGYTHTCALLRDGNVRCWGGNDQGQLGLGNADDHSNQQPYQLPLVGLGGKVAAITSGSHHNCALMQDSTMQCWGANSHGQLGLGHSQNVGANESPSAQVSRVDLGVPVQAIAAGGDSTCALLTDGTVRCWGRNDFGQLGLGHTNDVGAAAAPSALLAQVTLDATALAIGVSGEHACAALSNYTFRCWGRNQFGQLDDSATTSNIGDNEPPTSAAALNFYVGQTAVTTLLGSGWRTFVLYDSGMVAGWGYNLDGALGAGSVDSRYPSYSQRIIGASQGVSQIAAGSTHACQIQNDHSLYCWGLNDSGQLGTSDTATIGDAAYSFPRIDLGFDSLGRTVYVANVGAGEFHTCAWLTTHELRCWGYNSEGQLGLGYISNPPTDFVGGDATHNAATIPAIRLFGAAPQ